MSSSIKSKESGAALRGAEGLRTQKVDIVASMLMSGLVVIGLVVFLLFVLWLTQTFTWSPGEIVIENESVPGRGDHAAGFETDIEPPGAEEVEELTEPTLQETLEAVTDAATSVAATLESIDSDSVASTQGTGQGDYRPPGPLGDGDDIVPRYERWELKFQSKGMRTYAQQLDFFKIELGCVGGGVAAVDYAHSLSTAPEKRSGSSTEENKLGRLYFMWRQEGPLKEFDRQLLTQAGVQTQGRQILKFIPKPLEDQLAEVEKRYFLSQGKTTIKQVAKTIFECRAAARGGYEFVVIEQRYRVPKS
ncbi:MAG: hypothetical protein KDB22_13350 [Planctomycetales bacterium]|nr:hypothetical protein [Planctomycetales bacterium]